ncbi:hypothetical protein PQR68_13225 [Paraburkholderia agricolaris]|jgi:hypothetical protein|uniref:Uncharacterized protein n=1 Tax=Paraburkholderia agricolaris TaxID=2152888 RepID=A0ABW9A1H8_9BURK|nr:hypothetical protein [Paraburkholderia agricolaris]
MPISSEQAAQALREVEQTRALSSTLYGYQKASPHLFLWGLIWLVGFSLNDFFPSHINLVWVPLDILGIACSTYLATRNPHARDEPSLSKMNQIWRWLGSILTIMAFFVAVQLVMQPTAERQVVSLMMLIVSMFYVLRGLWGSSRMGWTGIALAALTAYGFYEVRTHYDLWMAVVGGVSLILAGLWLRRT